MNEKTYNHKNIAVRIIFDIPVSSEVVPFHGRADGTVARGGVTNTQELDDIPMPKLFMKNPFDDRSLARCGLSGRLVSITEVNDIKLHASYCMILRNSKRDNKVLVALTGRVFRDVGIAPGVAFNAYLSP